VIFVKVIFNVKIIRRDRTFDGTNDGESDGKSLIFEDGDLLGNAVGALDRREDR
jgi:hypothetical protein